jgi:hypothetical protein
VEHNLITKKDEEEGVIHSMNDMDGTGKYLPPWPEIRYTEASFQAWGGMPTFL